MRYTITGYNNGSMVVYEETNEIRDAEDRFMMACLKCSKVTVYDREEYANIMNY